ncbi:hypothetical protein PTKU64_55730 [Paraburkholderia terrae]|uniref:FAD/NAD(P)-binding domain-containing protein n=1 Tax=Paraburkholderia terrae TaxID=311230 RepID=A0ABM7TSZ0_9BURK|nr:hypothetical protein PTKU64_55730 [Paraburkholderia terrae]
MTLVDRCAVHVWKPLLHEVATGSLDTHAHEIAYAAHSHWNHFNFVHGEMTGVDRDNRCLKVGPLFDSESNDSEVLPPRNLEYDTLVLALGSRTHFFGVPGAEEHAIALDTLQQAERLRKRLLQVCLKKRAHSTNEANEAVDIAIIGGGATGVELAAELRRMEHTLKEFRVLSDTFQKGDAHRAARSEEAECCRPFRNVFPKRRAKHSKRWVLPCECRRQ